MNGISPSRDTEAVKKHFDHLSATGTWSQLYATADGATYHFHVRRQRVLELLPGKLGCVADVGCGPGVMVDVVRERGGTFDGFDLSPEMVQEAASLYGHLAGVRFRQGNIEKLEVPDESYDQVICMAVIEYLKTPDLALAEIARILKPGGVAIVTVPKRWHVDRMAVAVTTPFRSLAHAMGKKSADLLPRLCLQPDELDAAAARAGLKFDGGAQYHFTPFPYPLPRVAPSLFMRLNTPFEKWYATRSPMPSVLAHGYIGRYRKN